jgi:hypothetical protein
MTNAVKKLEKAAIQAHEQGTTWAAYWEQYGNDARRLEPYSRKRFRKLVDRLLCLLTSGDDCGTRTLDDSAPWERDDVSAPPADVGTQARFDWATVNEQG